MSENIHGARPDDGDRSDTTRELDALRESAETEILETTSPEDTQVIEAAAGETQVIEAGAGDTQVLQADDGDTQVVDAAADDAEPGHLPEEASQPTQALPVIGPDEPLSIFDQPSSTPAPAATQTAASAPAFETPSDTGYSAPGYPTQGYGTPGFSASAPAAGTAPATPPAGYGTPHHGSAGYGTTAVPAGPAPVPAAWTPPPAPLVRTTPRTGTIVWGFVILAIGIGVLSVVAGATLDVGLAMIWLLAAAGAVLIVSSIAGAARRRRRT